MKAPDSIGVLGEIWSDLMASEGIGTDYVAVKCVDMIRNTKGVGRYLGSI
ncbi:hypothetical protein HYW46_04550 [Candidatus Daviesbacteria bacterium]|nr:hypothetical protein [Candidatus Daviesbacteria bacterium]